MNSTQSNSSTLPPTNASTDFAPNNMYYHLYGDSWSKTFLYLFTIFIVHIVGPILNSGIIIFESFGGDPQKRNVINRLLSLCCANQIIFSLILGFCLSWRELLGLIDGSIMTWIEGFAQTFLKGIILFYGEMTILRFLYIVVWKRVIIFDDKFWTLYLSMVTYLWCCCFTIIDKQSSPVALYVFKLCTGNSSEIYEDFG